MNEPVAVIALWVFIYSYLILASVDFGASFYLFYGQKCLHRDDVYAILNDFVSPVSEVINICVVFFFAALSGFFPEMTFYYRTPLAFSGILAVILTIAKGTFFAVGQLADKRSKLGKICAAGNGIAGVLIPAALSIAMVISEGGFVNGQTGSLSLFLKQLVTSVYFWTVMIIAVVSVFYISAMFLSLFARLNGNPSLSESMRHAALFWSMPTVVASGLVFLGLEYQNPSHFMAALNESWMFLLSLVCLLAAVALLFLKRGLYLSFLFVMLQYFFALLGYSLSHLPFVIYPDVRVLADVGSLVRSPLAFFGIMLASLAVPSGFFMLKIARIRRYIAFQRESR
ncbi:cytochrome d ubiquinol oxidase subunit II [Sporolactobacillus sp. THM7-7]|nr:cytochrome d ubiquinol oxidase subunit II [Sporolactobacillus sp. THM7-7]